MEGLWRSKVFQSTPMVSHAMGYIQLLTECWWLTCSFAVRRLRWLVSLTGFLRRHWSGRIAEIKVTSLHVARAPPNADELCKESTPDGLRLVRISGSPERYRLKSGGLTTVASIATGPVILGSENALCAWRDNGQQVMEVLIDKLSLTRRSNKIGRRRSRR